MSESREVKSWLGILDGSFGKLHEGGEREGRPAGGCAQQNCFVCLVLPNTGVIMEYYSDFKMNEIVLFAATWVDLEIIILSEGS